MADHSAAARQRARHPGRRIAGGLALLLVLVLSAVSYWRIPLAEAGLHRLAARAGLTDVDFAVARLDLDGASVERLRLGDALRIERIDLVWGWDSLLSQPIARVAIRGVMVDADALRALIARRAADEAGAGTAVGALARHMPAVAIAPVTVTLPLPAGKVTVTIEGTATADLSGAIEARGRLEVSSDRLRVAAMTADGVRLAGPFSLRLADNVLALTLPAPLALDAQKLAIGAGIFAPVALKLTGAMSPAARLALDAEDPIGSLVAAFAVDGAPVAIRYADDPAPATLPLAVAGTLRIAKRAAQFDGRASGAGGVPAVAIVGRQSLTGAPGAVTLSLAPLHLGANAMQPGTVLPALARLSAKAGVVSGSTSLAWDAAGAHGTARIAFDGVSIEDADSGIQIDGLEGSIDFDSLTPPATPLGQHLRIARLDSGVVLDKISLGFQLLPDRTGQPVVAIESFAAGFAGGTLSARDATVGASGDVRLTLAVGGVDLGPLLGEVGAEGIGGTGVLDGTIPVQIADGRIAVEHARLATRAPGRLSIRSAAVRDALAGAGKDVALMLSALEDFHYDRLTLTLEKPAGAVARLRIETLGRNPAVEAGRPFAINLNLETDLDRIAAGLADALRLPGRIVGAIVKSNR